ncbi:MAG: DoxX family membrane protein [Flavobacteriaceae bacterium]|nr:DoxX family membrane protein [Flavobacteriaceae bacterium]
MKYFVHFIRILVGLSFVISGFLKMIDPLGTSYKLEEYFSASVLNLELLIPYALLIGIILILIETVLGIFLLIGFKSKWTIWGLFLMIFLFLFLTWYSAYFNKVTDCGCFGDAIKLTPWETFYKNVILLVMIVFLEFKSAKIHHIFNPSITKWLAFLVIPISLYFMYYTLLSLPIIDFRPYKIGTNIAEGMQLKKGEYLPSIHDFILESEIDGDITFQVLQEEKVLLVIIYDLQKSDKISFDKIKEVTDLAISKNYLVYGVSASLPEDFDEIKTKYQLNFEILFNDATTLKTMIRANPGLMMLKKGTIVDKRNWIEADKLVFD